MNVSSSVVGIDPRHVQVIAREEHAVCDPVPLAKAPVHPREQVPAEEELLAERGVEHDQRGDDGEPAPRSCQQVLSSVRAQELEELAGRGPRDCQEPLGGDGDGQRQNEQPQLASAPTSARSTRAAEPERVSHDGPPQRPLFTPDERHHEHELPDEPGGQCDDQCADQGAWAAQLIGEQRCNDPREQSHGQGGCGPDPDDAAEPELGQGTLVGRCCGAWWRLCGLRLP